MKYPPAGVKKSNEDNLNEISSQTDLVNDVRKGLHSVVMSWEEENWSMLKQQESWQGREAGYDQER